MRRKKQCLSEEESVDILQKGSSGVLALLGDEGYPYALPISYVYHEGHLYFHSAKKGHKIDAIKACSKASFCVIEKDEVHPERFTTYFRSVIVFGKIRCIEDEHQKMQAIQYLIDKYCASMSQESQKNEIQQYWQALQMIAFDIEKITGKEAIELVKAKDKIMNI